MSEQNGQENKTDVNVNVSESAEFKKLVADFEAYKKDANTQIESLKAHNQKVIEEKRTLADKNKDQMSKEEQLQAQMNEILEANKKLQDDFKAERARSVASVAKASVSESLKKYSFIEGAESGTYEDIVSRLKFREDGSFYGIINGVEKSGSDFIDDFVQSRKYLLKNEVKPGAGGNPNSVFSGKDIDKQIEAAEKAGNFALVISLKRKKAAAS